MRRLLLVLALAGVAILILRRMAGALAGGPWRAQEGRGAGSRRAGTEQLVRDRVCNTFIPRARALQVSRRGEVHWFCSDACRTRYLSETSRGIDAA